MKVSTICKSPLSYSSFRSNFSNKEIAKTYLSELKKIDSQKVFPKIKLHEVARDAIQSSEDINQKDMIMTLKKSFSKVETVEIGTIFGSKELKVGSLQWRLKDSEKSFKELCDQCLNKPTISMILAPGTHPSILDKAIELTEYAIKTKTKNEWAVLVSACEDYAQKNTNRTIKQLLDVSLNQIKVLKAFSWPKIKVYISKINQVEKTKELIEQIAKSHPDILFSLGDTSGKLTPMELNQILESPFLNSKNTSLHLHNGPHKWTNISVFLDQKFYQFDINLVACGGLNPLSGEHKKEGQNLSIIDLITYCHVHKVQLHPTTTNEDYLTECLDAWEAVTSKKFRLEHPQEISSKMIENKVTI